MSDLGWSRFAMRSQCLWQLRERAFVIISTAQSDESSSHRKGLHPWLLYQFDVTWFPGFVEPRFERAVESQ